MSEKKRIKKMFEDASIESADVDRELPESAQPDAQSDVPAPEANVQKDVPETSAQDEEAPLENPSVPDEASLEITETVPSEVHSELIPSETNPEEDMAEASVEPQEAPESEDTENQTSDEDLLEDVRRSLIEAESDKDQKESKWWRRIGRRAKKSEPEQPPAPVEIDIPSIATSSDSIDESQLTAEPEPEVDQIDDLIDLLKTDSEERAVIPLASPEPETPPVEPQPAVDFEELKKQAFRPRSEDEEPEPLTDVRSIALEGGEEVMVEVEAKAVNPMEERLSAVENALKPYRQYIYIALAILGVGMAVFASLIIFRVYQQSRPEPVQNVSNLPYPSAVSLPGGWSFKLGKGTLQDGKWDPQGPEWLEGTEVCRWVALPWSRQLEAVVRTLNPKDPINLTMSNNDQFVYQVYSVRQLTPAEMQKLDSNSACLLIILIQPNVEKRWVLTALP